MKQLEEYLEMGGIKKEITFLILSTVGLVNSLFHLVPLPFDSAWVAIILCGIPILLEAMIGLTVRFDIKADVLVSIALVASVVIHEEFAAGEIAVIMQLGALLEDLTVSKARAGIEKLVHLTPRTARRINNDNEEIITADEVKMGDVLRVVPGETVPVDGVIIEGETSVNQAVMTGESLPVDKSLGDMVFSGTVNQYGTFDMKASKVGEDSSIQRMIRLVQSADASKAKIVGIADRWATWIVVAALLAAFLAWIFTGEIIRAVTILVVFCPCALVLATPTAIMAAIGNATKHGFLVREGDALERLAAVKKITFDKTGTLTYGEPKVMGIHSYSERFSDQEFYGLAASVERKSEHPLGKAIVKSYDCEEETFSYPVSAFKMVPGRGVSASLYGERVLAGNKKMLVEESVQIETGITDQTKEYMEKGCTIIYLSCGDKCIGFLALSDRVREYAADMIDRIKECKADPVLLTGDHENAARHMAKQLHIEEFFADCLPEDKMSYIEMSEKRHQSVCMIGDGINDAPALKRAYVGIAMGKIGSDIAVDAADIVLVNDDIGELPHLLKLTRKMMTTIKGNLIFSMLLNFIAVILAITGILNPIMGALVHNAGSVFVILNSSFLLTWKCKFHLN